MDISIPSAKEFHESAQKILSDSINKRHEQVRQHPLAALINQKRVIEEAFKTCREFHPMSSVVKIEYDVPEMRFLPSVEEWLTSYGYDVTYYAVVDRPELTKITISATCSSPAAVINYTRV